MRSAGRRTKLSRYSFDLSSVIVICSRVNKFEGCVSTKTRGIRPSDASPSRLKPQDSCVSTGNFVLHRKHGGTRLFVIPQGSSSDSYRRQAGQAVEPLPSAIRLRALTGFSTNMSFLVFCSASFAQRKRILHESRATDNRYFRMSRRQPLEPFRSLNKSYTRTFSAKAFFVEVPAVFDNRRRMGTDQSLLKACDGREERLK